ncbi:hypothetical protein RGP44_002899 [Serratia marcescens]|uniref:hypothetical protein n=1 Tax=Serratia marcescens TaxID=615 RepID=UPI0012B9E6BC|nr:hypothetical protein [Serratia marcescens]ELN4405958.1 hypothetical protein [Serratia marcescens]HBC0576081.1 hypothetical protein [Serratia marcescens]HBV3812584.1 hypothetical protein [Serratia marcescens]
MKKFIQFLVMRCDVEKKDEGKKPIITTSLGAKGYENNDIYKRTGIGFTSNNNYKNESNFQGGANSQSKYDATKNISIKGVNTTDAGLKFDAPEISGSPEGTSTDLNFDIIDYYKDRARINREIVKLSNKSEQLIHLIDKLDNGIKEKEKKTALMQVALDDIKGEYNNLLIKSANYENKIDGFKDDLENSRNSFLGIIALFASFFSFISVSINIFSKEMSIGTSISIVVIIWVCLISFVFVFMAALSKGFSYFSSASIIRHFLAVIFCIVMALIIPGFIIKLF